MNMDLDNELMIFRTTWLRVVAYAWSNVEFREVLTNPPKGKDALDIIADVFPQIKASHLGNAITFSVKYNPEFVWIGNDWSWYPEIPGSRRESPIGPAEAAGDGPIHHHHRGNRHDEGLTLRIPLEAPKTAQDTAQRAAALADYYATRPSIFSSVGRLRDWPPAAASDVASGDYSPPHFSSSGQFASPGIALTGSLGLMFNKMRQPQSSRVFSDLTPQNGQLIDGSATFLAFEIALTVSMAHAWDNIEFRKLIQNAQSFRESLMYARGYVPPWQLRINVKHDETAEWTPLGHGRSRWTNLARHELTLSLPKRPERDDDWSVALAAYNATGAQYPFSCCLFLDR